MSGGDDMTLRALLEQSNELARETRDEMRQVRAVAAREADCAGRAERERLDRAEGFKRVWDELDSRGETIDDIGRRIKRLEDRRTRESGEQSVKRKLNRWVFAALAAAAGAALTILSDLVRGWM